MLATAPAPPARVVPGAWNASILVGTHHKTGTVVLAKVFRVAARIIGVPRHKGNRSACAALFAARAPGVCIEEHVSAASLRAWLTPRTPFIHAVRDPLEMCVSAYQYHLHATEPWVLAPLRDLGGKSLQQHYRALPAAEGVRFECRRARRRRPPPCYPALPSRRRRRAQANGVGGARGGADVQRDAVAAERADAALRRDSARL